MRHYIYSGKTVKLKCVYNSIAYNKRINIKKKNLKPSFKRIIDYITYISNKKKKK